MQTVGDMMNLKKLIVLVVLASLIWYASLIGLTLMFSIEIDHISTVNHIQDGDTFAMESGHWVRLADIDTPESGQFGYYEAGTYLSDLIYQRKVYLDIDDVYTYDYEGTGNRLVCVAYVPFNDTHYINVNKALLVTRHAVTYPFYNEFSPSEWRFYTPKLNVFTFYELQIMSGIIAIVTTGLIYVLYRKIANWIGDTIKWVRETLTNLSNPTVS